jgi:hypothetical protein
MVSNIFLKLKNKNDLASLYPLNKVNPAPRVDETPRGVSHCGTRGFLCSGVKAITRNSRSNINENN